MKFEHIGILIGVIAVAVAFVVTPVQTFAAGLVKNSSATTQKWVGIGAAAAAIALTLIVGRKMLGGREEL